ncbi:MAG: beta-lactamase family protein [Gammaproteobacteria bacterium]|nr:beta-lactamase family protein [Gammaproteobacteria bacterium]
MFSNWRIVPLLLMASLQLVACVGEEPLKLAYNSDPVVLSDDWTIDTPESQNIDANAIEQVYRRFFSDDEFYNGISLLVIRNGVLVAEGYARDYRDRTDYEAIQSATKSVSSMLTGIALDEGIISSLDLTLNDIYPEKFDSSSDKQSITLHQLLTMSSGIDFDNSRFTVEFLADKPNDTIRYILNKPMYNTPGAEFYYRDADPHLLSYAIQKRSGQTLAAYAQSKLFTPLNITNYQWLHDHTGITYGAYGIYLTPRDFAKLGQLMLQQGQWNGVQIIPATWVSTSTQKQIDKTDTNPDTRNFDYGYYWWLIPSLNAYTSWGHGGNFTVVVPDKNLVVVLTSYPYSGHDAGTVLGELLPLVEILVVGAG